MDSGQCSINPKSKLVRLKRKKELARKYPKTTISNEMLQKTLNQKPYFPLLENIASQGTDV
ncbi:MAG: hypothetical protein KC506_03830, partial [Nanoarchaeota archaeon]|nr:hypothetical protein [Nanoarchaeota archaeon]